MTRNRVLVTGGAGFIGTHLCRALIREGNQVVSIDRQAPLSPVSGVCYLQEDIKNLALLKSQIHETDIVFHLAATVSVPYCEQHPLETYENNTLATFHLLELIAQENSKRDSDSKVSMVYASSSAVYGDVSKKGEAVLENRALETPFSFYGAQKLASEHGILLYAKKQDLKSVIFRFFNVYGPGQSDDSPYSGVISLFIKKQTSGEALTINGDGLQTRDFISVHDIVSALIKAQDYLSLAHAETQVLNLGSGKQTTILELAKLIIELSKRAGTLQHRERREGHILYSLAEVSKAKALLSWEAKLELNSGIQELIQGSHA